MSRPYRFCKLDQSALAGAMEFFESAGCKSCCRIASVATGLRTSRDDSLVLSSLADEATFLPRVLLGSFAQRRNF
jgi:hypothetical protein